VPGDTEVALSAPTQAHAGGKALPVGYQLGEYTIQSVLGQGGFGITYLARDSHLGSLVAIKEYFPEAYAERGTNSTIYPRPDGDQSDAEIYSWGLQEFLKEAQALARFKHNHIVRVLRYLEANGTAYMIMEYEAGENLTGYLRKHGGFLNEPDLLRIFLPILTGLQAVHEAGLLHLDIKPDNIYLRSSGQPMLIDFGSARQRQRHGKTETGRVALTRGYSALEQYPGQGVISPSTDVYSVGATLYRCITGREPIESRERLKKLTLSKVDPQVPATKLDRPIYAPHIRQCVDLAMSLQAAERPISALALQNGLMGKEAKEEKARPATFLGRGSGFIGVSDAIIEAPKPKTQTRGLLESTFLLVVACTALGIASVKILLDTDRLSEDQLFVYVDRVKAFPYDVGRAIKQFIDAQLGNIPVATAPTSAAPRPRAVRKLPVPAKTVPDFNPAKSVALTLAAHAPVRALGFLHQNQILAASYEDGAVNLWNADTGALISTLNGNPPSLGTMTVSADGHWLAFAVAPHAIQIWSAAENAMAVKLIGHTAPVMHLAFSADGKQLASIDEQSNVLYWDLESGIHKTELPKPRHEILTLAMLPEGRVLAAGDIEGGIQYWDLATSKELAYVPAYKLPIHTLAYSPDGKWLVSGGQQHNLKLWASGLGRNDQALKGAPEDVYSVQFSADSRWVLVGGTEKSVDVWSVEQGTLERHLAGHDHAVTVIAVSSDSARIATAAEDGKILIWH